MATRRRGEDSPGTRPAATFKIEGEEGGEQQERGRCEEVGVGGGDDHRCLHRVDFVSTSQLDMPTLATDRGVRGQTFRGCCQQASLRSTF